MFKKYMIVFISIITIFGSTACSTYNQARVDDGIKIERVDSKRAKIGHVYITRIDDQLTLRGQINRRLHGREPIPGHLHATLINPQGKAIKETDIGYMRRSVKSSIASFSTIIPVSLDSGSKVKINYFV